MNFHVVKGNGNWWELKTDLTNQILIATPRQIDAIRFWETKYCNENNSLYIHSKDGTVRKRSGK